MPVDPGQHRVVATAPRSRSWETVVTVTSDADTIAVVVPELEPSRGVSSDGIGTHRVLAIVSGAVGVAGLVAGTAFGLDSKSKHDEAERSCSGTTCRDQAGVDLRTKAVRAGNLSTVGFVVGALGLAGGAALWLTAKSDATTGVRSRIGVGLGTLELTGTW